MILLATRRNSGAQPIRCSTVDRQFLNRRKAPGSAANVFNRLATVWARAAPAGPYLPVERLQNAGWVGFLPVGGSLLPVIRIAWWRHGVWKCTAAREHERGSDNRHNRYFYFVVLEVEVE